MHILLQIYDGIGASHNLDLNADTNTLSAVGGSRFTSCRGKCIYSLLQYYFMHLECTLLLAKEKGVHMSITDIAY